MLNIRELEKRWLHYKIKSYIPHAIIVISLFIIIIIAILFMTTDKQEEKTLEKNTQEKPLQTKKIVHDNSNEKKTLIEENRSTSLPTQKVQVLEKIAQTPPITSSDNQQMTLTPSMNFMKHIQSEEQQPFYQTLHKAPKKIHKKSKPIKRTKVTQQQNKIEEEYIDIQQQPQTKHKIIQMKQKDKLIAKPIISIERKDSEQDIKEVIRRFKKNNNPALSLFVAKKYYELGNYEQAYNYALITNGINNDIEDSWIIFAKSLVKLHKRDMALKTLAEYIKYSHSGNAKILFNDIRSGKFQ